MKRNVSICFNLYMKKYLEIVFILSLTAALLLCTACSKKPAAEPEPSESICPVSEPVDFALVTTATPEPVRTPEPTPEPTDTPRPYVENVQPYVFAWLSDTQYYSRNNNGVFECMTQYIADNLEAMNIQYIIHTGDLVHNKGKAEQWDIADRSMQTIDSIPNGVCAGNHDVGTEIEDRDYSYFCKHFGEFRYKDKPWYGGSYLDNKDHYDLLSIGNTDYIFVYLGYQVLQEDFDWAVSVLNEYKNRVGILCTHDYFYHDLSITDYGQKIHDNVVKACPNIYMVLCGHRYNCACIPEKIDDNSDGTPDRTVLQMIANYQAIGAADSKNRTGGDGYMLFLTINEEEGTLSYISYSPYLDDSVYFDTKKHQKEKYSFSPDSEQGTYPLPWFDSVVKKASDN